MKIFQKIKNRIKQNDGSYLLTSFWTSADSIEMDDGRTLTRFKTDTDTAIGGKGDGLSYDEETNMLYLLSGDRQISGVEIISSGASGKVLGDVTGVEAIPQTASVTIKWTDPSDDGDVVWAGTTLIRKKWSRPVDCLDGTVVVESTTRNQYKTTGYVDDELDSNTTYYYRFFPYDTQGHIRTGLAVAVNTLKDETVIDEFPEVTGTYTYNGSLQEVQLSNFDSDKMVISSGGTATNAGTYNVSVAPVSGLKWPDNTTDAISLSWTINKAKIAYTPSQIGEVTYTGSSRTPGWSNYDESQLAISGTTSATDVGDYTATFTPTSNYTWYDGSVTGRDVTWTLSRATIAVVPSQNGTLTYTGSEQSPTWNNYDNTKMTISGQTSGTDAGTYTAVFTPTSNYKWSDGTVAGKQVSWSIGATSISTLPSQSGTLTYDGTTQTPSWSNYDSSKLTLGGATSAKNAGTYTAVFTPRTGYSWWDGTTEAKSASWTIGRQTVSSPTASGTLTYNGSTQYPAWSGYDSDKMTIGGTTSATDAGTYSATFVPTSNYCWSGGGTGTKSVSWVINKANSSMSLNKNSITVNTNGTNSEIIVSGFTCVFDDDDNLYYPNVVVSASESGKILADLVAMEGSSTPQTSSVLRIYGQRVGSVTVTVKDKGDENHYELSKTFTVTVTAEGLTVPSQSGTLTYNGYDQSPTWNGYDSTKMTISDGVTSASTPGGYNVVFVPKTGYTWNDGTTTGKTVTWRIQKANGSASLSKSSVSLESGGSDTVSVSGATGTVSVASNNTSVATASISGSVITITGASEGSTTITVNVASNSYYTSKTLTINVSVAAASGVERYTKNYPDFVCRWAKNGSAQYTNTVYYPDDTWSINLGNEYDDLSRTPPTTYWTIEGYIGFAYAGKSISIRTSNSNVVQFASFSGSSYSLVDSVSKTVASTAGNAYGNGNAYFMGTVYPHFKSAGTAYIEFVDSNNTLLKRIKCVVTS